MTSVVGVLLMSNVLGLIAATNPTMTAGIPERWIRQNNDLVQAGIHQMHETIFHEKINLQKVIESNGAICDKGACIGFVF